jgi:hypothetical protein
MGKYKIKVARIEAIPDARVRATFQIDRRPIARQVPIVLDVGDFDDTEMIQAARMSSKKHIKRSCRLPVINCSRRLRCRFVSGRTRRTRRCEPPRRHHLDLPSQALLPQPTFGQRRPPRAIGLFCVRDNIAYCIAALRYHVRHSSDAAT